MAIIIIMSIDSVDKLVYFQSINLELSFGFIFMSVEWGLCNGQERYGHDGTSSHLENRRQISLTKIPGI